MAIIGFISLGCAKNQVDCERMMYRVQEAGHTVSPQIDGCDIAVINTCGFIDSAKTEAIDNILQAGALKGAGRVGKILVTRYLSQRYQQEILDEMPEVDGVLGTAAIPRSFPPWGNCCGVGLSLTSGTSMPRRWRLRRVLTTPEYYAYLKIAEGCDNHCAYCVIPSLRGRFRSRGLDEVLYEARVLASQGIKELIVVAQDTSRYGTDLPGGKRLLATLLRELCKIDGIHWVRLHYLYPDEIDDELIDTIANEPKIVKYLDIPIQHCNDAILEKMNRRGNGDYLRWLLPELRRRIPGLVLRTSIITGLPGEGEEEFAELCQFLKDMRMERVEHFPSPPREKASRSLHHGLSRRGCGAGKSPDRRGTSVPDHR